MTNSLEANSDGPLADDASTVSRQEGISPIMGEHGYAQGVLIHDAQVVRSLLVLPIVRRSRVSPAAPWSVSLP
jgi:hypothetical protein